MSQLHELIESGEYFKQAKEWYRMRYIYPFSHRSFLLMLSLVVCIIFGSILFNIYYLFPTTTNIQYVVNLKDITNKGVKILKPNYRNDAQLSIVNSLASKYIISRENYNYDDLKRQFTYVKNNSTRIIFRRFMELMSIDNPDSPILKYKKDIKREVQVIKTTYPDEDSAIITFSAIAQDGNSKKYEDKIWQAKLEFEVDKIDAELSSGQRFNFTITDYQLQEIKNNLKEEVK